LTLAEPAQTTMHVYETTHPVAHSAEAMFALVANVEDYPKFLPLCEDLKVTSREEREGRDVLVAP
jgi:coenzyme Q-binding protein COQ10